MVWWVWIIPLEWAIAMVSAILRQNISLSLSILMLYLESEIFPPLWGGMVNNTPETGYSIGKFNPAPEYLLISPPIEMLRLESDPYYLGINSLNDSTSPFVDYGNPIEPPPIGGDPTPDTVSLGALPADPGPQVGHGGPQNHTPR